MTDFQEIITNLKRPGLLVRAVRLGLGEYDRARDLARITGQSLTAKGTNILEELVHAEAELEATRKNWSAGYSVSRHIEVLTALIAEFRTMQQVKT